MCTTCVLSVHGSQNKASDSPELELQTVMNFLVGTGNPAWVLLQEQQMFFITEPSSQQF